MDFHEYFRLNYGGKAGNNNNKMTTPEAPLDPSNLYNEYFTAAEHATERVATLVNDDFECTNLFCQMDMLRMYKDDLVWKEMARWIRYEEAVEEGGERWSKPHVASLMMEALQDLQNILSTCPVILDSKAKTMREVAEEITNAWTKERAIMSILKEKLISVLLKQHKFQHFVKSRDMKKKTPSSANLQKMQHEAYINKAYEKNTDTLQVPNTLSIPKTDSCPDSPSLAMGEMNKSFMKKIPHGSEVVNLLVGEIPELDQIIAGFVRLKEACNLGDITEVDLNTKFIFIVLGPKLHLGHCAEMCRCMATLFTDEIFRCVAYRAEDRIDLLCGIQEFSLHLTVLPPGVWNPSTRIEPPDELPSQDYRKSPGPLTNNKSMVSLVEMDKKSEQSGGEEESHSDPTLVRTGRLFGGLVQDIRRKLPHYLSDFKDALHIQCVASFFFLFLATLTPNVTFGGLLTLATDQYMGTMECILAAAISGILFALFAGQPLNILGSTGPMLILEGILYRFCKEQEWDFLPFRVWVGFWTGFFILLIVAFDLSALVRYITRFTEESFACLIALIFIFSALKKTFEIEKKSPVEFNPPEVDPPCFCMIGNITDTADTNFTSYNETYLSSTPALFSTTTTSVMTSISNVTMAMSNLTTTIGNFTGNVTSEVENVTKTTAAPLKGLAAECFRFGGHLEGHCEDKFVPDVFFFSLILVFGTYFLATVLVHFRHSLFFPTFVRQNVSDFAVLISIIIMVLIDYACGLPTPKLLVPEEFKPTKPDRPWVINPISDKNPWWLMLLSALPALLATILIFMDQQITAVIVNRRENKLKKGSGYHLDMLIVGILVVVHALLGLPWYVAATVTALAHIMSLRKVSECTAPGEKPTFLGVREQRVTGFLVGVFSGLAVLITSVLKNIPMPVLYGVFLYMGVAPLSGMQLCQRILLVFMPAKYQPDYSYIRNVPIKRVHLFTVFQVLCLAGLWVVKSIKSISIAFPLMVLIICFVRKGLDKIFTQRELKWLDDILPATHVKKGESEMESEPEKIEGPVLIKVTTDKGQWPEPPRDKPPVVRTLSAPEKETATENGELPSREALKPRMSLTFVCKTDIDRIKAMTPEVVTNRRQSLAIVAERKRSVQAGDVGVPGYAGDRRKFSSPLMVARKLSVEAYASPFGNIPTIEEHNKLNRMLSLPATIADENENENESDSNSDQEKS